MKAIQSARTAKMHRTYSMRQSRAPTAAQIQNPPPPSSSTKSNRFFGKASVGAFDIACIDSASKTTMLTTPICRPYIPQSRPSRCLRARPRQKIVPAREDGEERHEIYGAGGKRAYGGCRRCRIEHVFRFSTNDFPSNNFQSGVKDVMTMSRMSRTSSVCSSMRLASLKTNLSTDTTNTA